MKLWIYNSLKVITCPIPHLMGLKKLRTMNLESGSQSLTMWQQSIVFGSSQFSHSEVWRIVSFPFNYAENDIIFAVTAPAN